MRNDPAVTIEVNAAQLRACVDEMAKAAEIIKAGNPVEAEIVRVVLASTEIGPSVTAQDIGRLAAFAVKAYRREMAKPNDL